MCWPFRRAHVDQVTAPFAIVMTASRDVIAVSGGPATRGQTRTSDIPPQGGDFVYLEYRIIMRSTSGTIFAFRPKRVHGGTHLFRMAQTGVAISNTKGVRDQYEASQYEEMVALMKHIELDVRDIEATDDGIQGVDG